MKRLLLILPVFLLAGCLTSVPVKMNFPQVPEDLKESCPALKEVDPNTEKLSEVIRTVSTNYGEYNDCRVKVDAWIQWYNTQKKIFEEIK